MSLDCGVACVSLQSACFRKRKPTINVMDASHMHPAAACYGAMQLCGDILAWRVAITSGPCLWPCDVLPVPLPACSHAWSLVDYLPSAVQQEMLLLATEYLYK